MVNIPDEYYPVNIGVLQPMTSVIIGGHHTTPPASGTRYNLLFGGAPWAQTEAKRRQLIPTDGVISDLHVELQTAPTAGSYTFRLVINGTPVTGMDVTIGTGATQGYSTPGLGVTVSPWMSVSLQCITASVSPASMIRWAVAFTSDYTNQSIIIGGYGNDSGSDFLTDGTTRYNRLAAGEQFTTESYDRVLIIPCPGTIKNFYFECENQPGAGNSLAVTIRRGVPGGSYADTPITGTITGTTSSFSDITNSIAVSPGDRLVIRGIASGSTWPTQRSLRWGVVFEAAVNGDFILSAQSTVSGVSSPGVYYSKINPWPAPSTTADETIVRSTMPRPLTVKALFHRITAAMASGEQWSYTIMKNGLTTPLTLTYTGPVASGAQQNISADVNMTTFDDLSLQYNVISVITQNSCSFSVLAHITPGQ